MIDIIRALSTQRQIDEMMQALEDPKIRDRVSQIVRQLLEQT